MKFLPASDADREEMLRAIGVGRVEVSPVPSGVGDITVVVGKDFTG